MALISPIIQDGILTYLRDESPIQIVVDSPNWYAWLQSASTFTFRSEEGFFTARKERAGNRRGSATASCTGPIWVNRKNLRSSSCSRWQ